MDQIGDQYSISRFFFQLLYELIINKTHETTLKIKNKSPLFKKSRNKFSKILINHAIYFCDINP